MQKRSPKGCPHIRTNLRISPLDPDVLFRIGASRQPRRHRGGAELGCQGSEARSSAGSAHGWRLGIYGKYMAIAGNMYTYIHTLVRQNVCSRGSY